MFSLLNLQSLLGLVVIVAVCWAISENRRAFPWRLTLGAIAVQAGLVLALFAIPGSQGVLAAVTGAVDGLAVATTEGTKFVFGYLAGGDQPYAVENQGALFTFAFQVLPLILVISALSALLWHWKILKWITLGFGFLFQKTMGLGGASALAVAANIFLGMIESPIVIRAYLDKLTRSEIFLMMVVGLATVAGSTMVAYATILAPVLPNAAGHVLVASIVSAPAGVLLARIIIPEKEGMGGAVADYDSALKYDSAIDAIVKGTSDGLMVVLNISAVLIVFVAFVALVNVMLGGFVVFDAPADGRADAGLDLRPRRLADWGGVEGRRRRGLAAGRQADPDRVRGLHRPGQGSGRRDDGADADADDLRPVRLRQHRLGRHHGDGSVGSDARAARRGSEHDLERSVRGLPGHVDDRRHRGRLARCGVRALAFRFVVIGHKSRP